MSTLLLLVSPAEILAEEKGCSSAADKWIKAINCDKSEILLSHANAKCTYAWEWMKEYEKIADRERMCTDLVLIWTHKECVYFRDYMSPDAYDPCKKWTRQMFSHCMTNNLAWFP